MPDTPKKYETPTRRTVKIVGRPGGGRDGAHGGVCFYDGGKEFRLQPGDIAEVPMKVATSLLADGLATAEEA